jgi:dipeptidyl aminopeptidase/acylaminoacyl peptidase
MAASAVAVVLTVLALLACSTPGGEGSGAGESSERPSADAVLYTIGVSTDPYGTKRPHGFGVASGLLRERPPRAEIRSRAYGWFTGAEWLDRGRILVHRSAPPLRPPAIFRFRDGKLEHAGTAPFTSGSLYAWSPDWSRLAWEPPAPCRRGQRSLFRCYRGSGRVYLADGDGRHARFRVHASLGGWTRDGRLVVYRTRRDHAAGRAVLLDLRSGRRASRTRYWVAEQPLASADGRYLVQRRAARRRTVVEISTRDGRVVQRASTPYIVSMLAWSPRGHRLAYTTSGFPDPHELYVIDAPGRRPRRIFATGAPHFDWVTWSPDGRWLLLDGDQAGGWRLFSARTGRQVRVLPRLGGVPFWCCPQGRYSAVSRGRTNE